MIEAFIGLMPSSVTLIFNTENAPTGNAPSGMLGVLLPKDDPPVHAPADHLIVFVGGINPLGDRGPSWGSAELARAV